MRYLLPVNPGYVVIGLSLANEGIWEARTRDEKEATFTQYAHGTRQLVDRARQHNIVPVVGLVYPRMMYGPLEYEYVRRMNLFQNSWDVPSVNFLGALDDGTGHYTVGFDLDDKHPNAAGHREFVHAFVPTLFDALESGKPTPTRPEGVRGFARISAHAAPLEFASPDTIRAFALRFMVRAQTDGVVAAVHGSMLTGKLDIKTVPPQFKGSAGMPFQSMTLTKERPFNALIRVHEGKWTYQSSNGAIVASAVRADAAWHDIAVSHYTARGETVFFVDGSQVGTVAERLEPNRFIVGGSGAEGAASPKQADYKDVFLFRAGLNADEVSALHDNKILQASLEIYSPLDDPTFRPGTPVRNRAQSLSTFRVGSDTVKPGPGDRD